MGQRRDDGHGKQGLNESAGAGKVVAVERGGDGGERSVGAVRCGGDIALPAGEGRVEVGVAGEDQDGRVVVAEEGGLVVVVAPGEAEERWVDFEASDWVVTELAGIEPAIERGGDWVACGRGGELPIAVDVD